MADLIKIVPERVKEEVGKIRDCREQHIDLMDRLTNLVINLADIWEGQAYDTFSSSYKEMQKEISKFAEVLESYAAEMDDVSNRMQNTDQTLASKINSLS